MKRLLIATDFSPASDRAVEYGLKLAQALDATATIVAVYEEIPVPVADTRSLIFIDGAGSKALVEEGLQRQQTLFQPPGLPLSQTLAVKGPVVASILDTAAELKADMIIAGMKGKGKSARKLLGSTVTALAKKTAVPLLVVPEDARFVPPADILLGENIHQNTNIHILDPLRELTSVFKSKLYALHVIQNGTREYLEILHGRTPLQDLDKTWDIRYEFEMGGNVADRLNNFARTHKIELVVMIPRQHSLPERWFMKSHTREMIFEARLPLLLLPERG